MAGCNKKFWWKCCDGILPDGTIADDHEWQTSSINIVNRFKNGKNSGCPCCKGT